MPTISQPTTVQKPPAYRRQPGHGKRPDRAFVVVEGKRLYLGAYGSPESHQAYARLLVVGQTDRPSNVSDLLIAEFAEQFDLHALSYYGTHSSEYIQHRANIDLLVSLYGATLVREFRPADLKVVRSAMIDRDWCRTTVNRAIVRLRTAFKWGVSEGLVPAPVWQALSAVPGLRRGRSNARETEPVRPVPDVFIEAVKPHRCEPARHRHCYSEDR